MTTKELIDAAVAAKTDAANAEVFAAAANAASLDAAHKRIDADQALHDDLAASGPAVTVSADIPPVVVLYRAADPDGYAVETVRVA